MRMASNARLPTGFCCLVASTSVSTWMGDYLEKPCAVNLRLFSRNWADTNQLGNHSNEKEEDVYLWIGQLWIRDSFTRLTVELTRFMTSEACYVGGLHCRPGRLPKTPRLFFLKKWWLSHSGWSHSGASSRTVSLASHHRLLKTGGVSCGIHQPLTRSVTREVLINDLDIYHAVGGNS